MTKQDQYQKWCEEVRQCRKCSLGCELNESYDPHVLGQGDINAKLMFMAEAPGLQETIHQRPLTSPGKSGAIYEKLLTSLGLTRDQVYTTNSLVCRPPKNRDPLPYESITCRDWLVSQLKLVQPKLVITFGRFAAQVFIPQGFKLTKDHGKIFHSDTFRVDVFPLFHPAYVGCYAVLARREEFKQDVSTLKQLLKGY